MDSIDKILKENEHFPVDPVAPENNLKEKKPGILEFALIIFLIALTVFTATFSIFIIFEKYF